ncbi:MAG TPA: STAS domain-containing protein [Acidimicrobiales bacterium]
MAFAVHGMGLTQPARAAREAPEVTVVSSPAELDCNTARVLVERVMEALAGNDGQPIVVELATVQFIDASGLRVLFGCRDLAARVGRPLTYREPSPAVLRLAEIFEDVALLLRAA